MRRTTYIAYSVSEANKRAKAAKRRLLGLCEKESVKSLDEITQVFVDTAIYVTFHRWNKENKGLARKVIRDGFEYQTFSGRKAVRFTRVYDDGDGERYRVFLQDVGQELS